MEKFIKLRYEEVETKKISEFETSFAVSPLERGLANTLGNAMRRTLLSSVPGVAPFAVKIEGAAHEFQTLKGVKEDVVQIILNLKTLRFEYNTDIFADGEIIKVNLDSNGTQVVAKDIMAPTGVRVINVDHHIAELSKEGSLKVEIYLRAGRGFVGFDSNKEFIKINQTRLETKLKSGAFIAVDSDFSPVKNVSYESTELNSASAIIQEKLTLNVRTDGSVEAKDALAQASHILMSHLEIMSNVANIEREEIFQEGIDEDAANAIKPVSIVAMDLSVRSYNCLKRAGYETLEDLASLTKRDLATIKNLGKKSVDEIIEKLAEYEITLEGEE